MGQAAHGVVEVGGVGDAHVKAVLGLVVVGVSVGNGDGAELAGLLNEFVGAGGLRCDNHQADNAAAAVIQPLELLKIRRAHILGLLSALFAHGNIGAFQMDTQHPGAALFRLIHAGAGRSQGAGNALLRQGHGGGAERSHPVAEQKAAHGADGLYGAVAGVLPVAAVNVDVHKTGYGGEPSGVKDLFPVLGQAHAYGGDFAVADQNFFLGKAKAFIQDCCVFNKHGKMPPV